MVNIDMVNIDMVNIDMVNIDMVNIDVLQCSEAAFVLITSQLQSEIKSPPG
jgi:hypothetical protein